MTERNDDKLLEQISWEDEQLLAQFFGEHKLEDLPDEGFSQKVMNSLPDSRLVRLSRWWTAACILIGVVLVAVFLHESTLQNWLARLDFTRLQYFPVVAQAYLKAFLSPGCLLILFGALAVLTVLWVYNEVVEEDKVLLIRN